MDKKYWENIANSYETEIFDVLQNDRSGKIIAAIETFASKKKSIIDIGCAVGKWMPVLAPNFKKVLAIDISQKNLNIAKKKHTQFKNIEYAQVDMSAKNVEKETFDAAICINAILTASLKKRNLFFEHMSGFIKKKGDLILVVPSLESKLYSHMIANKWNVDNAKKDLPPSGKKAIAQMANIKLGVTDIDDIPTKHFLKEELELLLDKEGFTIESIEKINYAWDTEFHHPPKWLKKPEPWDWMVKAKKNQ